ncbi:MAG: hypothetical protein ACI4J5_04130 [Oscillospiraceae bacterium]
MSIDKYIAVISDIKAPDDLKERTAALMNKCSSDTEKRRIPKLRVSIVIAAVMISLIGISVYAYNSGWIGLYFGNSADKLMSDGEDYSAELDNIEIRCTDPDLSFEIISAYDFDEFLFYELKVSRKDGVPLTLPEGFDTMVSDGGFGCENTGSSCYLRSDSHAQHCSNILGETEDGGINVLCDLYASKGFTIGDHMHVVLDELVTWRPAASVISSATVEIEFDIAKLPKSNKRVIEVNKTAHFDSGDPCEIRKITVSPMCIVVTAASSDGEMLDVTLLRENKIVLKSGEVIEGCGINPDSTGSETDVFLFREFSVDSELGGFVLPEEIASVQIGDLVIECE